MPTAAHATVAPFTNSARLPLRPPTQDSIGDPYYPQLGNGGYDVQHYALELAVDVEHNVITSTATIAARATADLRAFNLDLLGLSVDRVAVNAAPVSVQRTEHELTITPMAALHAGQPFTTTVAYHGTPEPFVSEAAPISVGWTQYDGGIYVASEPEGASTWYPVNDHPLDKATYSMRVTVPKPYVVAANGLLQQTIDNGATTTYVWATAHPLASYLVTVDIARYKVETATGPNGLPIRNYFPPEIADQAHAVFAPTADMIAYFSSVFGPYPFEAYGVAVIDKNLGFAMETQTMSVFGRDAATQPPNQAEDVVAHELAHQWFGDSVSLDTWQDIWLNESFATYAAWLWSEHELGPGSADHIARRTYMQLAQMNLPPTGDPPPTDLFNTGVYERGALVLHALRLTIGDEAFFRTLRTYAARFRDGNASTPDFVAVAEQVSGQNLDAFFDNWLYGAKLPPLPPS
jgi:aminopeptidase N